MSAPTLPRMLAGDRWWSADELDAIARGWRMDVLARLGDEGRPVAAVLAATVEAVALFVALASLPSPLILLNADARAWRTDPPLPRGTPVVLTAALAHLGAEAERVGLAPIVLGEPRADR